MGMTVKEMIERLSSFPEDMEVVVGHPMHDYCRQVEAAVPTVGYAWKHRDGPWAEGWTVEEEVREDTDEDDEYVDVVVIA
jgi:hypothetical protein